MTTAIGLHQNLAAMHYDLYKDVHGIRPRWVNYDALSIEQLETDIKRLIVELKEEEIRIAEIQSRAVMEFEDRVQSTIQLGACNRAAALQWIMEADGAVGDWEYLCYLNDLPYDYFQESIIL
jgi:hypothetical protein